MTPCRYCPEPGRPYAMGWLCPDHAPPPQPVPPCVAPIRNCGCGEHFTPTPAPAITVQHTPRRATTWDDREDETWIDKL